MFGKEGNGLRGKEASRLARGLVPPRPFPTHLRRPILPEIGLRAARLWAARKECRMKMKNLGGGEEQRLSRARPSAYPQIFPQHRTAHRRMVKTYKREPAGLSLFYSFSIKEEFEQDFTSW